MSAQLRIACVSYIPPRQTGAGGNIGLYGLAGALAQAGHEVHFIIVAPQPVSADGTFTVQQITDSTPTGQAAELRAALAAFQPDVVWILQPQWVLFAPLRHEYPHILYSFDPEWDVALLRRRWYRPQPDPARALWHQARIGRDALQLLWKERQSFRQAAQRGLCISYTASEAPGMSRRSGVEVTPCPLVYPDFAARTHQSDPQQPRALLLGSLNSVHTRYGLAYFFGDIWDTWRTHANAPRAEVRVVGSGSLPDHFPRPPETDTLRWIGFVPSLDEEWERATAMLVPVPISNGVRSRIVEAWARKVPVIAHPAAEIGLPQMRAGVNYLAAVTAQEWIDAMKRLEDDPVLAAALADEGRRCFDADFSYRTNADRFDQFTRRAIERFGGR